MFSFVNPGELPATYTSLRGGGFKRLVRVCRTVSHTQEPFTLPFIPKVSVLTIDYHIRWRLATEIHLPPTHWAVPFTFLEAGDFFRKLR
ncbi:hypothetical protein BJQ97_00779 [Geobacillus sp. TFV-3]|nr:hypothetical protein BJQ97_00779 [Geobacillus sp. TFV-3]